MNKNNTTLFIILAVIIIAAITNPKSEDHKLAVKEKANQYFQSIIQDEIQANQDDEWSNVGAGLGMLFGTSIVDKFIDGAISSDNYVIFSLTKATFKDETKTIGFGIFGNVFLSGKIDEALKTK